MKLNSKAPLVVVAVVVVAYLVAWLSGYSVAVNSSKSMPRGLYLVGPLKEVQRGQVVALCIPNAAAAAIYKARDYLGPSSRCAVGLPPVLKPVVAIPGDLVEISAAGTSVNGTLLPNSRVFDTDSDGRPIDHLPVGWSKRLGPGEFFALANYIERSLDSRYYGTVTRADLQGRALPIFTN